MDSRLTTKLRRGMTTQKGNMRKRLTELTARIAVVLQRVVRRLIEAWRIHMIWKHDRAFMKHQKRAVREMNWLQKHDQALYKLRNPDA